jgi:hypothetical protein
MYEQPMKRAGLTLNRILYSNTKAIAPMFGGNTHQKFMFKFNIKTYANGKMQSIKPLTDAELDKALGAGK